MKLDWKNPPKGVMIALIAVLAMAAAVLYFIRKADRDLKAEYALSGASA